MSVHMCECDYFHSCVSVVTNLSGYVIVCVSLLAPGPATARSPPRFSPTNFPFLATSLSPFPSVTHLLSPPVAPPFALFTHDTLNQEEINADDAFTVSLSPSFCGWILRWQQHWGNYWREAFSKARGCLCAECVFFVHVCVCVWTYMYVNVSETKKEGETET